MRDAPHIGNCGCKPEQHAGRSGRPKIRHCSCSSSCTQRTPAGLPPGMPGIGLEIDGAMQQAPQPGRQACACPGEGEVEVEVEDGEGEALTFTAISRLGLLGRAVRERAAW